MNVYVLFFLGSDMFNLLIVGVNIEFLGLLGKGFERFVNRARK